MAADTSRSALFAGKKLRVKKSPALLPRSFTATVLQPAGDLRQKSCFHNGGTMRRVLFGAGPKLSFELTSNLASTSNPAPFCYALVTPQVG
jgi:hypothetical protein